MEIRFSGHAKNKLRLYKLALEDVESVINLGETIERDNKMESKSEKLRVIWILVGSYALAITIIKMR
jgi:hypothetical protein